MRHRRRCAVYGVRRTPHARLRRIAIARPSLLDGRARDAVMGVERLPVVDIYFRCADDGSVDPAGVLRGADHPDP